MARRIVTAMTSDPRSRVIHGVGVFSGRPATLTIAVGTRGLTWHASGDHEGVLASIGYVSPDTGWTGLPAGVPVRNTTIASGGRTVATIEHVMGALAGSGVWNAAITLEGVESPILDGSAKDFVTLAASLPRSSTSPLTLASPVEVRNGNASIIATPLAAGESLEYTYELDYGPGAPISPQRATWRGEALDFANNIAPARTFSLLKEVQQARALGLFAHMKPADLLVIGDDGQPIDNSWRMEAEPARHKLLDLIGDLALLGRPLRARVVATRAGHALTHEFCRAVLRSLPSASGSALA